MQSSEHWAEPGDECDNPNCQSCASLRSALTTAGWVNCPACGHPMTPVRSNRRHQRRGGKKLRVVLWRCDASQFHVDHAELMPNFYGGIPQLGDTAGQAGEDAVRRFGGAIKRLGDL